MGDYRISGEWMKDGMVLAPNVKPETLNELQNFVMTEDHILIAAYPKTGITWTQELVWLICNNGDTEKARSTIISDRVPFLEKTNDSLITGLDKLRKMAPPFVMKTHLHPAIFHKEIEKGKVKVIVIMRNPKDTLVSLYHFYRIHRYLGNFKGSWHEFFELYKVKHLVYGDYFEWYSKWLQYKDKPNVLLVKYEDMHRRLPDVTDKLSKFLDKSLSEKVIPKVFRHLAFDEMRANDKVNYTYSSAFDLNISPFIRKGKIGDWKDYFSEEESALVDKAYKDFLEPLGVHLEFE